MISWESLKLGSKKLRSIIFLTILSQNSESNCPYKVRSKFSNKSYLLNKIGSASIIFSDMLGDIPKI